MQAPVAGRSVRARAEDGQKTGAPKKEGKKEEESTPSTAFSGPGGPPSGQVGAVIGTSVRASPLTMWYSCIRLAHHCSARMARRRVQLSCQRTGPIAAPRKSRACVFT